jgi:thiol-disulfide isomerase/thioredoxin
MKKLALFICFLTLLIQIPAAADESDLRTFDKNSYRTLLSQYENRPLVLVLWSITCSSCMKEMAALKTFSETHPELSLVLVSVDDFSDADSVRAVLEKNQLTGMDNWLFSEANSARLRFQIDPAWYGELPRTYFYNAAHERTAVSGVLSEQDYDQLIQQILS